MAYEKQDFKNGANLFAEQLEQMEDGIIAVQDAILHTPQTLTEAQKAQARANIGAAGIGEGGAVDAGAVLYTEQTLAESQKEQARKNIGAASADDVSPVAPRAMIRQLKPYIAELDKYVKFEDVFALADAGTAYPSGRCNFIYALEAHATSSTEQRVFKSNDGENWSVLATLTIDAANGVWYTDLFVDKQNATAKEAIILIKTTNGFSQSQNKLCSVVWNGTSWYASEKLDLGNRRWLSNNGSIDACTNADWSQRAIIFGEYATTTDGSTYSLWKGSSSGSGWKKVLELTGDSGGTALNGEIRHWHTVQADPYNKGHWWASSGDGNAQCRIYRSTDMGETWELLFSGSQRERTCQFVFEQDCIYYGMDSTNNWDKESIKLVKIDRSKLETDRENCREDVASVDSGFAVYGLTRTFYPDGLIVWTQQEPGASFTPGRYILQFYDYGTKKMYPIAHFDTTGIANTQYIGFYAGAKVQHCNTGVIIAKPTRPFHQARYGDSYVSTHMRLNLTM